MASPAYDGKGQPSTALGWFSGLATWWNMTPQYVMPPSSGVGLKPPGGSSTAVTIGPPGAPAGKPGTPADSSAPRPAASATDPGAAKP